MYGSSFRHEMLEYRSGAEGFLRAVLPHVEHALADSLPVLIAVSRERIGMMEEALGDDAQRVGFTDMRALGRNPARIIPAWREFLETRVRGGDGGLGIGEPVWPGRSKEELSECDRHEHLLSLAFDGGRPWSLLCPYDVDGLDDEVIETARRSHPSHGGAGGGGGSGPQGRSHRPFEGSLPTPRAQVQELIFAEDELGSLRHFLSGWAEEETLDPEPTEELVLAVNELATNSIRYGGGRGRLRVWREDGTLLCEIRDRGHIEDPLAGRACPPPEQASGRGLWLVNHLCDLVQIRSSQEHGTTVRVHKNLA